MSLDEQRCPRCDGDLSSYLVEKPDLGFCLFCRFPLVPVAGKYQLLGVLGEGGFGTVYRAKHLTMQRDAKRVVKVMKPEIMGKPEMRERFLREVQMTSALSQRNPHIVRVFDDFGEIPNLGYFYVMEFLDGKPLTDSLSDRVHLPSIPWCLDVFAQLCDAMQAAHEENIVHRDLKPDNILLIHHRRRDNFVKVLDFGIAKPIGAEADSSVGRLTQGIIGTPFYVAPEQINNTEIDARTDIFTMGVILHELLTGEIPLIPPSRMDSTSLVEILTMRLMAKTIPSLRSIRPDRDIPEGLDLAVQKALSVSPADRFPSAEAFWEALQPYARESTGFGLAYGSDAGLMSSISGPALSLSNFSSPLPSGVSFYAKNESARKDVVFDETDEMKPLSSVASSVEPDPDDVTEAFEMPPVLEEHRAPRASSRGRWIGVALLGIAVLLVGMAGGFFSQKAISPHLPAKRISNHPAKQPTDDQKMLGALPAEGILALDAGVPEKKESAPEMSPERMIPEPKALSAPPVRAVSSSKRRRRHKRPHVRKREVVVKATPIKPKVQKSRGACGQGEIFLVFSPSHVQPTLTLGGGKCLVKRGGARKKSKLCRMVKGGVCVRGSFSKIGVDLYGYTDCIFTVPKGRKKLRIQLREDDGSVSDLEYCLR
ncbi:MAG: serine/threonine protein kinase [Myxococcales bacterium]|nr:serine/threonine protein kinase [Myxococcales bacterium]